MLCDDIEIILVTGKANTIVKKLIYLTNEKQVIGNNLLVITFKIKLLGKWEELVNSNLYTSNLGVYRDKKLDNILKILNEWKV